MSGTKATCSTGLSYQIFWELVVGQLTNKEIDNELCWWCLFFWLFTESNLVLEFRLFVFLLFHDL